MNRFDRKIVSLSLICFLLTTSISFLLLGYSYSNENDSLQSESTPYSGGSGQSIYIKNPENMIVDTIGEPETVDPHWAYDPTSEELISNVYDTLVGFNRERIQDDTTAFELRIADSYTISPDGLTYTFHIREDVKWGNSTALPVGDPATVEPEDVEYSFERGMLMSHDPTWMLTQPLLGCMYIWDESKYDLTDPTSALQCVNDIRNSVTVSGRDVTFHLAAPYTPLMQILSQTWASIMDQEWTAQYTWNGVWPTTGADAVTLFSTYTYPETSPIDDAGNVMMGCGPYTLTEWVIGDHWKITRFADYYLGWPAAGAADWVETAQVNLVPAWATRKLRFLAGDADITGVPRANIADVILGDNIRGTKDLPTLSADALFFNYAIPSNAMWKPQLGGVENLTLLSDINLRKAFASAINYAQLCQDAFFGEAKQVANPIIEGIAFYDPTDPAPVYDLTAAENYLKAAWGGELWSQGFTLPIVYDSGNTARQTAALLLEDAIESIGGTHGPFNIEVIPALCSLIIPELYGNRLPAFVMGSSADFADPHNLMTSFMHPFGDFSGHTHVQYGQSTHTQLDWNYLPGNPTFGTAGAPLTNDYVAALIEEGVKQLADVDRNAIYRELADIYYDERPNVISVQATGRHWEQDWVQGWYYNSLMPGYYFYHLWKGLNADINGDQTVDFLEFAKLNAYWWDGTMAGSVSAYNRVADIGRPLINPHTTDAARDYAPQDLAPPGPQITDNKADTQEMDGPQYLTGISGGAIPNIWDLSGGYTSAYGDGFVDVFDRARINAEWGDTTQEYEYVQVHGPTKLAVDPLETVTAEPFIVDITAHNIIGILGFQFKLTYNTSVLTATGFGSYAPFSVAYGCSINDEQGYVSLCYSWPIPEYFGIDVPETNPPLPICWISFNIDNVGTSALEIENSAIADIFGGDPVGHEVFNGYYRSPPIVRVFPQVTVGPPPRIGETFAVNITIADVTDLYDWQAGMTFNASVLECLSIAEGEFLKRAGVTTLWTPGTINNTIGKINYSACSITGPGPGVNGTGQLMSITFRVKGSGNSTLHITDVLLLDSDLASITPVTIVDGHVEIHVQDIAILSVTKSVTEAYPTWIVPFNVTVLVENQGTRTETFNITAYANAIEIGRQEITLAAGANTTLEFNWSLTGVAEGTYTIKAEATVLYGEIDTADNTLIEGTVKIKHPGDANDDMIVNAYDLGILAKAWTASGGVYDARADFNGDKTIDALDHDILKAYWP